MFTDYMVLVDQSRDEVNANLERQREVVESKGFKIFLLKMECMNYNLSGDVHRDVTHMSIQA